MDDLSFKKIDQSIKERKKLHTTFLENIKTYKPFLELEKKAFSDGELSKKTKELMALSMWEILQMDILILVQKVSWLVCG